LVIDQQSPQSLMTAAVGDTMSVALSWVGEFAAYFSLARGAAVARTAPRSIHRLPHVSAQLRGQAGDHDGILLSPKMAEFRVRTDRLENSSGLKVAVRPLGMCTSAGN
jgi:hypothetical protein